MILTAINFQVEEAAALRESKQHLQQINRIKAIKKEIRKEEKEMEIKTNARQEKKAINETRPGKYGPGKFMVRQSNSVFTITLYFIFTIRS